MQIGKERKAPSGLAVEIFPLKFNHESFKGILEPLRTQKLVLVAVMNPKKEVFQFLIYNREMLLETIRLMESPRPEASRAKQAVRSMRKLQPLEYGNWGVPEAKPAKDLPWGYFWTEDRVIALPIAFTAPGAREVRFEENKGAVRVTDERERQFFLFQGKPWLKPKEPLVFRLGSERLIPNKDLKLVVVDSREAVEKWERCFALDRQSTGFIYGAEIAPPPRR